MRQTFLDRVSITAAATLAIAYFGCTQDFDQFDPDDSGTGAIGSGASSAGGNGNEGQGASSSSSSSSSAQGGSGTCATAADCDDSSPCTIDSCAQSACTHEPVADGAIPGGMDLPTDCTDSVCQAGAATVLPDDTEVPDDGNACTSDVCVNGAENHPAAPEGTPCAAGTCNANGQCVGCVEDGDCGEATFCQTFNCNAGVCEVENTSDNQTLPDGQQAVGDCQELRCNGTGGVKSVNDNGDEPLDDGNQCTGETCNQGTPVHPPEQAGKSCSAGVCNGAGLCVECVDNGDCSGSEICNNNNMCVCPITCQTLGLTCGTTSACGQTINCNDGIKNGTETDVDCGGGGGCTVKCSLGKTCSSGFNCSSNQCADGVCCNTSCTSTCFACNLAANTGTCSAVPKFSDDVPVCGGTLTCDGAGGCKKENGQSCGQPAECASGNCIGGTCA